MNNGNKITLMRSYLNANFTYGRLVAALIERGGESAYCHHCRNIANAVIYRNSPFGTFYIPLCKHHYLKIDPNASRFPAIAQYSRLWRIGQGLSPLPPARKQLHPHYKGVHVQLPDGTLIKR